VSGDAAVVAGASVEFALGCEQLANVKSKHQEIATRIARVVFIVSVYPPAAFGPARL
jgi:hypothetical protein